MQWMLIVCFVCERALNPFENLSIAWTWPYTSTAFFFPALTLIHGKRVHSLLCEFTEKYLEKMAFGDVKTPKGLQELNNFLADRSYVDGWVDFSWKTNWF